MLYSSPCHCWREIHRIVSVNLHNQVGLVFDPRQARHNRVVACTINIYSDISPLHPLEIQTYHCIRRTIQSEGRPNEKTLYCTGRQRTASAFFVGVGCAWNFCNPLVFIIINVTSSTGFLWEVDREERAIRETSLSMASGLRLVWLF